MISAFQSGDRQAFDRLARKYLSLLVGYLRSRGAPSHLAEETVQEVMVKVYRHLPTFKPTVSFAAWLFSIARDALVDAQRQQIRQERLVQSASAVRPPSPTPEDVAIGRCEEQLLLHELTEADRLLLELRVILGHPFREIAEMLEESEGSLRVRVHRLLTRLRKSQEEKELP